MKKEISLSKKTSFVFCSEELRKIKYLISILFLRGAHERPHGNTSLIIHLTKTYNLLRQSNADYDVLTGALFHSAYGTANYPDGLFLISERPLLQALIGLRAEKLVFSFCHKSTSWWKTAKKSNKGWTIHTRDSAVIDLDNSSLYSLALISIANIFEQLPRCTDADVKKAQDLNLKEIESFARKITTDTSILDYLLGGPITNEHYSRVETDR